MKNIFAILIASILSSAAFAVTNVQLDMKMNLNGTEISPTATTQYGKAAIVSQALPNGKTIEITVIPTEEHDAKQSVPVSNEKSETPNTSGSGGIRPKDAKNAEKANVDMPKIVKVNFVIKEIDGKKQSILSRPSIITRLGQTAKLTEGQKGKAQSLEFEVTPKEVTVADSKSK